MRNALVATLCAAGLIGMSVAAQATLFQFNPTGSGTGVGLINGAATIDEAPGNELSIGGVVNHGGFFPVGSVVQELYQANLNSIVGTSSNVLFANGAGGAFFTFVAAFSETVVASFPGGGLVIVDDFSVNPGGFFMVCAQTAQANDLTGTGFSCDPASVILGAHLLTGVAGRARTPFPIGRLDQSPNGDNYPGITSIASNEQVSLTLQIDSINTGYFPDMFVGGFVTTSLTTMSNRAPFDLVDPAPQFSLDGFTNGGTPSNIGTVNGNSGPNFQFQTDASSSFQRTQIPEPGTLILFGIAITGACAFVWRRDSAPRQGHNSWDQHAAPEPVTRGRLAVHCHETRIFRISFEIADLILCATKDVRCPGRNLSPIDVQVRRETSE